MTGEAVQRAVDEALQVLRDAGVDAAQVLVTWEDHPRDDDAEEGTQSLFDGFGNWFARVQLCTNIVERQRARTVAYEAKQARNEDEA